MRAYAFCRFVGAMYLTLASFWSIPVLSAQAADTLVRKASAFRTVGRIAFDLPEGRSTGTGFQVGDCTILTNFHVVFGPWYVTALKPPSSATAGTYELTGVTLPDGSHPKTRAVPVIWGDYTGPDRQFRKPQNDWVLLATEECLGYSYGYLAVNDPRFDEEINDYAAYSSIGYSSGSQMVDRGCTISTAVGSIPGGVLYHNCAAMPGDSGAPIIRSDSRRVVAITSGYRASGKPGCDIRQDGLSKQRNAPCSNVAVPILREISEYISKVDADAATQQQLLSLGYQAGSFGAFDQPIFTSAIRQVQSDLGLSVNGQSSCGLATILKLRGYGAVASQLNK